MINQRLLPIPVFGRLGQTIKKLIEGFSLTTSLESSADLLMLPESPCSFDASSVLGFSPVLIS